MTIARPTLLFAALLAGHAATAQVTVPDNAFEAYLEANGYGDGIPNNNNVLGTVASITVLNISGLGIADLTGIAAFTALEELNASNNALTSLPFSSLSQNLEVLDVSDNSIGSISIPVTNTRPIREFRSSGNLLTSLNASRLGPSLELLHCSDNSLTSLTLNNSGLQELRCDNNSLATIDLSGSPNLASLSLNGNDIAALNLSGNPGLQSLQVAGNDLTSLDLSDNAALEFLYAQSNAITSLNLLLNTQLQVANVSNNALNGFLLLNQHPSLTTFNSSGNSSLLCLQVADPAAAGAGAGQYTNWSKDAGTVYSLSCSTDFPYTLIPDPAFEQRLISQGIDSQVVLDGRVLTSDIASVVSLNVSLSNITDLTGIQDFDALESLTVTNNLLTALDTSQNAALEILVAGGNNIAALDLSGNPNLVQLNASGNRLTSLDLTANPLLVQVLLQTQDAGFLLGSLVLPTSPNLVELRVNGNDLQPTLMLRDMPSLTLLRAQDNPNLACIEVDDEAAADAQAGQYADWQKDAGTTYSEHCDGPPPNTAPGIAPLPVERTAGDAVSASPIATVSDAEDAAATLQVSVDGGSSASLNGVSVDALSVDGDGVVSASIVAACDASDASFTLRVTDSGALFAEASLAVTVLANPAPSLAYGGASLLEGAALVVAPSEGPSDNSGVASIALQSVGTFAGGVEVDGGSGEVTLTDAAPSGTHAITVRISDDCGVVTDAVLDVQVDAAADLAIDKTLVSAGPFLETQTVQYLLTVQNQGPSMATDVVIDDIPANLTLTGVSADPGVSCPDLLPCAIAALAPGASARILVTATIAAAGAFDNSATVQSPVFDPQAGNNVDDSGNGGSAGEAVDLALSLSVVAAALEDGVLVYILSIANAGPRAAIGARLTDAFAAPQANVEWTCIGSVGASCAPNGSGDIDLAIDLPVAGLATVVAVVDVPVPLRTDLHNLATVSPPDGMAEIDGGDNQDAVTVLATVIFEQGFEASPPP